MNYAKDWHQKTIDSGDVCVFCDLHASVKPLALPFAHPFQTLLHMLQLIERHRMHVLRCCFCRWHRRNLSLCERDRAMLIHCEPANGRHGLLPRAR